MTAGVGFLGGLFPTPLCHRSAELAERPASPVGVSINDGGGKSSGYKVAGLCLSLRRHSSESWNPRLQGCTPAWMQVVERRLEQAAEVVEPRREQATEEGNDRVVNRLWRPPACAVAK